jgi:hypothetical protein
MFFDVIKHLTNMKRLKINFAILPMVLGVSAAFAAKTPSHRFLNQFANTSTTGTTHWISQTRAMGPGVGQYTCEDDPKACTALFSNSPSNPPADGTPAPAGSVFGIYTVH